MAATTALERRFHMAERGSSVRTEVLGGFATFVTMSYIVFVARRRAVFGSRPPF